MKMLKGVRKFTIPDLDWNATEWVDIVDLDMVNIFEPSILSDISDEQLENIKIAPYSFPNYPLHSQSVERAVKLVTEAASKVVGEEKRHEHILSKVKARKVRKACDTKRNYKYGDLE